MANETKLTLTSLISGTINNLSNNSTVANFTQIGQATSTGQTGYIEIPSDSKTYTVKYYNAPTNTSGEIGDPFYFYNFSIGNPPPPAPPIPPVPTPSDIPNISNIIVGSTPSNNNTFSGGAPSPQITVLNDAGVTNLIQDISLLDMEVDQVITFGCFLAQ